MNIYVIGGQIVGFVILTAFIQKVAERVLKIKISNGRALFVALVLSGVMIVPNYVVPELAGDEKAFAPIMVIDFLLSGAVMSLLFFKENGETAGLKNGFLMACYLFGLFIFLGLLMLAIITLAKFLISK